MILVGLIIGLGQNNDDVFQKISALSLPKRVSIVMKSIANSESQCIFRNLFQELHWYSKKKVWSGSDKIEAQIDK